jgi:hypothetical protein
VQNLWKTRAAAKEIPVTRLLATLYVVLMFVGLAAGPVLAAPMLHSSTLGVTSPSPAHSPAVQVLLKIVWGGAVFGMIRVKDVGTISKKFVQRATAAGGDYKDGVQQAGGDWEANTKASEDNYSQGVQQAIGDRRFGKGVAAAGAAKYTNRATTLGAQRYGPGIQASEGEFAKGVAPYLQAIAGMTLPPRRPKGDPANQDRANAVARTLRALKTGK